MQKTNPIKIIGFILLTPALLSVLLFLLDLLTESKDSILQNLNFIWRGTVDYGSEGGGGGYTSALPLYFGLMAIAGAFLIKDK